MLNKIKKFYNNMSIATKAALWFVFCNIMQKGISTITVPLFTRLLTTAEYGTYSLYISWFNILTIVTSLNLYYGVFNNALNRIRDKCERDKYVSSMWGLTPDFLITLEDGFKEFFEKEVPGNPLKAEYLIPIFIGELLEQGKMSVKVLRTNDTWYGMTYHEDVAAVKDSFKKMLENGVYKADLFSDL